MMIRGQWSSCARCDPERVDRDYGSSPDLRARPVPFATGKDMDSGASSQSQDMGQASSPFNNEPASPTELSIH